MGFLKKVCLLPLLFLGNSFALAEVPFHVPKENGKRLLIGYSRSYPMDKSEKIFGPSIYHPIIGLRHISDDWVLGISMQFKFLKDKSNESKLVLWNLQEEINYRIRLYHPAYFLIGAKFLYLYPVERGKYPFRKRNDTGGAEIGVGASASLMYTFPNEWGLGVFADLWRGTASRKYQAVELGMHISLPLPF